MVPQGVSLTHRLPRAFAAAFMLACAPACSSKAAPKPDAPTVSPAAATASTTSTTSVRTTSSAASTTTSIAPPSPEQAIRAAVALAEETFSSCLVAMPNCDPQTLAVARGGPLLERNVARIREWNADGQTVRNRDKFRYVVEAVTIAPDGRQAAVIVCIADGSVRLKPGVGPGGADVVVDDAFVSGRSSWDMRLDPDGVWRAHDGSAFGPTESRDVCPAS